MKPYSSYVHYRELLRDAFAERKAQDAKWSHRFVAMRMGLSSVGWFGDVLSGTRKLKSEQVIDLGRLFGWSEAQIEFVGLLVEFEQCRAAAAKKAVYRKILAHVPAPERMLSADCYAYFEHWSHAALRELILHEGFDGDFRALQKRMRGKLSQAQLRRSLELLIQLGLLRQVAGRYEAVPGHLRKDPAVDFMRFVNYTRSNMSAAAEALDEVPKERRDFSSLTLILDDQGLVKARQEIEALRKRLRLLAEESTDRSSAEVHQCLFQVFPLSSRAGLLESEE